MRPRHLIAAALCALSLAPASDAQEDAATRAPDTGLAILDCAPAAPAPSEGCVLRVPPGYERGTPQSEPLGETEGAFRLLRPGRPGFPEGVELSATLLLVDLSPGPNGGRRDTFETEKALIARVVDALPATEPVAIYGFNEGLEVMQDFTTDRDALRATVEGLSLRGTNTRISTFVDDAISVLAERDRTVLKNLVVVSDGQEEGMGRAGEIAERAVSENVSISALGTFWRPVGAAETGRGMDYLHELTEDTLGLGARAILRQPDAARAAADRFAAAYAGALEASGLILSNGTPQPATISVPLRAPVLGAPGRFADREISARFTPPAPDAPEPPPEAEAATLFGLPPAYAYAGGAVLILALLAGLFLALRRRNEPADPDGEEAAPQSAPPVPPPAAKPVAFLVFGPDGRRIGVSGQRVSIGRASGNEVVIEDDSISRLHAQLHRNRTGGFSITDMDSLNGTFVNDTRVSGTATVDPGDRVTFGNVSVRLVSA